MSPPKLKLFFVSPIFLFPTDAGGKIRTTNILRGLKGGQFHVLLMSPAAPDSNDDYTKDLAAICDEFVPWQARAKPRWMRAFDLLVDLPVNVAADRTRSALEAVKRAAGRGDCDLMVFDFVHAAVLMPEQLGCASLCFTHNVEAEIFARHADHAGNAPMRWLWQSQFEKMSRYERSALKRFTSVIAVSERDACHFREALQIPNVYTIPTGVDLEFFRWEAPPPISGDHPETIVFTGSMDSAANHGGIQFFIAAVWPRVRARYPRARLVVVGRNPPAALQAMVTRSDGIELTGSVADVRPYVRRGHVFVIPLLVGGGTRIKAFEAMAMGCPLVSTTIGVEGLDIKEDVHYLRRDDPAGIADAIAELFGSETRRLELSRRARDVVETRFGHAVAAQAFEQICVNTIKTHKFAQSAHGSIRRTTSA